MSAAREQHARLAGVGRSAILLCALVLVVVVGAGFLTYQASRNSLRASIDSRLARELSLARGVAQRALSQAVEDMETWARHPTMSRILDDDPDYEIADLLDVLVEEEAMLIGLTCVSESGTLIAATNPEKSPARPADRPDEHAQFRAGTRYLFTSGGDLVQFVVPIFEEFDQPELIGTLRAVMRPDGLVAAQTCSWSGVTTASGEVVAQRGVAALDQLTFDTRDGHFGVSGLVFRAAGVDFPSGGHGPQWRVAIAETSAEVDGPVDMLGTMSLLMTGTAALLTVTLVVGFSRRQQRLLNRLAVHASELEHKTYELQAQKEELSVLNESLIAAQTESEAARLKAAEAAVRVQTIMDSAADGIITITEEGTVETFNVAAEGIFGYSAGEVIGKNVKILMPSPQREEHDGYLGTYLETGVRNVIGIRSELVGQRMDSSTFPLDLSVSEVQLSSRRVYTGIVRDITERKQAEQELQEAQEELTQRNRRLTSLSEELSELNAQLAQQARLDPLTKLLNRRAWEESAGLEHDRSVRYNQLFGVMMIDVDHFKKFNDSQGHQAGDDCLRKVAECIGSTCRSIDLVGRYGGEELVVLMPETDAEGARQLVV